MELLPRRAITWREHAIPGVQRRVVVDADEVQPVAQLPPLLRREGRQPGAQEPSHLRRVVSVDYRVKEPAASDTIGWLVCNALGGLWTVRAGRPCPTMERRRPVPAQSPAGPPARPSAARTRQWTSRCRSSPSACSAGFQ